MGFKVQRKGVRLVFKDGTVMDGAEVVVGSLNVGDYMAFTQLSKAGTKPEEFEKIAEILGRKILSWNLEEEDGTPIPHDVTGILGLELDMVMAIITAWTEGVTSVPAPLPEGSSSGATSPEVPIPMTPISSSPSLAS